MRVCAKCGHPYSQRSRRRPWERIFRVRAFRCGACSHRFLIAIDGTESRLRDHVAIAIAKLSLAVLILSVLWIEMPLY